MLWSSREACRRSGARHRKPGPLLMLLLAYGSLRVLMLLLLPILL